MKISYRKLWHLLSACGISAAELRNASGIAPNTMTKLRKDEEVSLSVLARICQVLHTDIGDIMEFVEKGD